MVDGADDEQPKRKKGDKGLPYGVSQKGSKFQGRVYYLPSGATEKTQRGVGMYDTAAAAAEAIGLASTMCVR